MDKGEIMSTIKETTLHPDGNEGVDLYPKTNINQVEGLPQKLLYFDYSKLSIPETPTADSAIIILTDGTVGTKPLSEIGGGKLYIHNITINFDNIVIKGNFLSTRGTKYDVTDDFFAYFLPGSTITFSDVMYGIKHYENEPTLGHRGYDGFNIATYEEANGPLMGTPTFRPYIVTEL